MDDLDQEPVWSPDGTRIAWRHGMSIWLMDADGSHKRQASLGYTTHTPRWSPDGEWIAFVAYVGDHEDLLVVPVEGDDPINLTQNPAVDLGPSWSPAGQEIAFETKRNGNYDIYKVGLTTYPTATQLTASPASDHAPAWSPDGASIAYASDAGQVQYNYALWLVDPDGTAHRRLSPGLTLVGQMSWSADARWLAVQGGLFESAEIYVVDVSGRKVFRLTTNAMQEEAPAWRPDSW
jgi:TolB protein